MWIEIHQSLPTHRKIVSAGHLLNVPRMSLIGHMVCLWTWALDNAESGNLTGLSPEVIALGAQWVGDPDAFVNALIQVGFLDQTQNQLRIHDWNDYAGRLIARRIADRERKRSLRLSARNPGDVRRKSAPTVPNLTVPNLTEYIHTLREIPGWAEKGEPHLEALLKWVKAKGISDEIMERAAIGLASVQKKTLVGYTNLASALQRRINQGYDQEERNGAVSDTPTIGTRFKDGTIQTTYGRFAGGGR